jgi:hypothetical protein
MSFSSFVGVPLLPILVDVCQCMYSFRRFSSCTLILIFLFGVRVRGVLFLFPWSVLVFRVLVPERRAVLDRKYLRRKITTKWKWDSTFRNLGFPYQTHSTNSPVTSCLLGPTIHSSTLLSTTLNVCSYVRDCISHPYKTCVSTWKNLKDITCK